MLKTSLLTIAGVALLGAASVPANAAILSVGSGGELISTPSSVEDDSPGAESSENMLGFDEKQGVVLDSAVAVDDGFISAGTRVNSHMIFLNSPGSQRLQRDNVNWEFDGEILGVMSDKQGNLEAASNNLLGAVGTTYPGGFNARGFENSQDKYQILGDLKTLQVSMFVTEPGDWIRVVTADVPEPASMVGLLAVGAVGLGAARKRKQASA